MPRFLRVFMSERLTALTALSELMNGMPFAEANSSALDFFSPTPVAHGDIAVVTAQEDLASLGEDVPLGI